MCFYGTLILIDLTSNSWKAAQKVEVRVRGLGGLAVCSLERVEMCFWFLNPDYRNVVQVFTPVSLLITLVKKFCVSLSCVC